MAEKIEVVIVDETDQQSQPTPPGSVGPSSSSPTPPPSSGAGSGSPSPAPSPAPPPPAPANNGASSGSSIVNSVEQLLSAAKRQIIQPIRGVLNSAMRLPGQLLGQLRNLIPNSIRTGFMNLMGQLSGPARTAGSVIWDKIAAKQRAQIITLLTAMMRQRDGRLPQSMRPLALRPGGPPPTPPGASGVNQPRLPTVPPRSSAAAARGQAVRAGAATGARAAGTAAAGTGATAGAGATVAALASNPVGWVIAAIIVAFSTLILATIGLVKVFKSQERELAEVSGEISGVLAQREVTRIESQIDRNERFGSDIAQFGQVWTNFEDALYNLITEMLDLLMPLMPLIELILEGIQIGISQLRVQIAVMNVIQEILDTPFGFTDETAGEAVKNLMEAFEGMEQAVNDFLTFNNKPTKNNRLFGANPFQNNSRAINPAMFNPPLPPRPGGNPP